jgi:predicted nucleic acid-binding protein
MNKLFVDTNIFIYALDKGSIHHQFAVDVLTSDKNLYTSVKNISEYFAVTSKLKISDKIIFNFFQEINTNVKFYFLKMVVMKFSKN